MSPSVAFVQTPTAQGSGVLIEGGYVVTNAHVVWPFQQARVVFPDGSEHLAAPVLNWDLVGDMAVIGPLQTSVEPVELVDGENLNIGSDLFLIGYPGEAEEFPQPTFTQGILSRLREWEQIAMTYFQTDAGIAGGQSGGALVSGDGDVIGISGLTFTEAGFGIVASSADALPRINGLISGEDVAGLGDRRPPLSGGQLEHDFTLQNFWDTKTYVINEAAGTLVEIGLDGVSDGAFSIGDVFGNFLISEDEGATGAESGSATTELDALYFLLTEQFTEGIGDFRVSSNRELIPFEDVDDGVVVTVSQTVLASMDYPGDVDYFVIDLEADDIVVISVDSLNFDPFLVVDFPGATGEQVASDNNSGGGIFGLNPELTFTAPKNGSYFIVVEDANLMGVGGYFLSVSQVSP